MAKVLYVVLTILALSCQSTTEKEPTIDRSKKTEISIYGIWTNGSTQLYIDSNEITIQYHGQCYYSYPANFNDPNSVELIWGGEPNCGFDNMTNKDFGLQEVPEIGKPFAKYLLSDTSLIADYYYLKWVDLYSEEVYDGVFTSQFYKLKY